MHEFAQFYSSICPIQCVYTNKVHIEISISFFNSMPLAINLLIKFKLGIINFPNYLVSISSTISIIEISH